MSRRPTEEDLGIETTPEEQEILARPVQQADDDIRQDDDDADESLVQAAPKPEAETAEAKAVRERDESGKFVAKTNEPKPDPSPDERKVDLRALQEARAENKVLMERMTALLEAQQHREARAAQPVAEAPPPVPTYDADPIGAGQWTQEQVLNIIEERNKTAAQQEAEHRERQEIGQAYAIAQPQFQQASATDPTMGPTYSALMVSFAREIAFTNGIPFETATPQQQNFIRAEVAKLETDHVKYAVGTRQNVADYVRGLAQARGINIQPQQLAAATPPGEQQQGKTIAERQQAQARHMSIGDLPGSAVPTTVSAKTIAKMSSAEFAAFAKKMGDAGLDEMFSKI
jgi:antitoxin component of RelBE/YafQ-DinJ toxin-antitoxin module